MFGPFKETQDWAASDEDNAIKLSSVPHSKDMERFIATSKLFISKETVNLERGDRLQTDLTRRDVGVSTYQADTHVLFMKRALKYRFTSFPAHSLCRLPIVI
jgi:hypothetical protein